MQIVKLAPQEANSLIFIKSNSKGTLLCENIMYHEIYAEIGLFPADAVWLNGATALFDTKPINVAAKRPTYNQSFG
jgi:hypothetical protein